MSLKVAMLSLGLLAISTTATAAQNQYQNTKPSSEVTAKKYCIKVEPMTGSRFKKTECRSKDEWARMGVDVEKPGK